ncbi:hypothetical protein GCM10022226_47220 [Sphaerisporangium flaviroseum]|uniref:Uncharacterized protein n=1 Tax=Sphaerisporangium flaviroseum TaxID=509199 RepID=A0ABP7ILS2_9ACTN
MTVSHRPGDPHGNDDMEITIRLTASEAHSIGRDALLMAEILDSCLWAMAMLRTGANSRDAGSPAPTVGDWAAALRGLDRLAPRLRGTRDAVVRAYLAFGGSTQRLADVMAVPLSEIQNETERMMAKPPDVWEEWATTPRPE